MDSIKILNKKQTSELLFIFSCFACLLFNNKGVIKIPMAITFSVIIMLVLIRIFDKQLKTELKIYEDKKALILFSIIYICMICIVISLSKFFSINNGTSHNFKFTYICLIQLGITSMMFLSYLFGISLKNYNWKISLKWILIILLINIPLEIISNTVFNNNFTFKNILNITFWGKYALSVLYHSLYPGLIEEVIYRGFLISGLKGMGLNDWKCNIIQAILFGIMHVFSYGNPSWMFLLTTATQVLLGYVLGKVYLKTKSLSPCILLHGLINAI